MPGATQPRSISWLVIVDDVLVGEPLGDSVVERIMRTLKEECLWSHLFEDVDELRRAAASCVETCNDE